MHRSVPEFVFLVFRGSVTAAKDATAFSSYTDSHFENLHVSHEVRMVPHGVRNHCTYFLIFFTYGRVRNTEPYAFCATTLEKQR